MKFNVADLPAVQAQLQRDVAEAEPAQAARADVSTPPTYARAPAASGPQQTGARPAAITRTTR